MRHLLLPQTPEQAADFLRIAEEIAAGFGVSRPAPPSDETRDLIINALRQSLGDDYIRTEFAYGRAKALAYALPNDVAAKNEEVRLLKELGRLECRNKEVSDAIAWVKSTITPPPSAPSDSAPVPE